MNFCWGLGVFFDFTCEEKVFGKEGVTRCQCLKCKNWKYLNLKDVKVYIYLRKFMLEYWCWACYGEEKHIIWEDYNLRSFTHDNNFKIVNQFENIIFYATSPSFLNSYNHNFEDSLNEDANL